MKNSFYVSFGVWIAILPLFGIPDAWKDALVIASGLFLVLVSLGPSIMKMLQPKQKPRRRQSKIVSNNPLNPPYVKGETEQQVQNQDEVINSSVRNS